MRFEEVSFSRETATHFSCTNVFSSFFFLLVSFPQRDKSKSATPRFNLGRCGGVEAERFESKLAFLLIAAFIGNRHANSNNDGSREGVDNPGWG